MLISSKYMVSTQQHVPILPLWQDLGDIDSGGTYSISYDREGFTSVSARKADVPTPCPRSRLGTLVGI